LNAIQENLEHDYRTKDHRTKFAITRKTLKDLAFHEFGRTIGKYLCRSFKGIKNEEKKKFMSFQNRVQNPILVAKPNMNLPPKQANRN